VGKVIERSTNRTSNRMALQELATTVPDRGGRSTISPLTRKGFGRHVSELLSATPRAHAPAWKGVF
jgi:hypothetical protein